MLIEMRFYHCPRRRIQAYVRCSLEVKVLMTSFSSQGRCRTSPHLSQRDGAQPAVELGKDPSISPSPHRSVHREGSWRETLQLGQYGIAVTKFMDNEVL